MTYLRPNKSPWRGPARTIGFIAGVFVLFIILIQIFSPHTFSGMMTAFARPFWRANFAIQNGALRSPEQLLKENAGLQVEIDGLKQLVSSSSISSILSENEELRAMFHRASSTPYTLAAVLARPLFMPYDEIIIDLGTIDGISTTTRVYAPGNILIGRVREALSQTAKVELLTTPGGKYNVLIGASHIPATALGIGGGQYRAEVPHGTALQVGDMVSDSSANDGPLGTITSIVTDPADPFDTILFAPDVNVYQLRWVLVDTGLHIKPKK